MLNPILKVFNFFPKKIKKNCLFFLVILLLISSLELLSVGLIIPVVKFFLNENFFLNLMNKYNFYFLNKDNFLNNKNFFYSLLISLFILVILLKNLITIFFTKTKNLIASNIHVFLSNKLFLSYLEISFDKFILESKSILIKNIIDETNRLRYSFLLILTILSELFISLVILIFMFLLYPKIILPILILAIVSILFIYLFNKKQIYLLAKIRLKTSEKIYQLLNDTFFNIKDVLLKDLRSFFLGKYKDQFLNYSISVSKNQSISESTKYYVEIVFVIIFFIFFFFNKDMFAGKEDAIIFLSVFLLASYRILPSINRISQSLSELKNNLPSSELIVNIFENNNNNRENFFLQPNIMWLNKDSYSNQSSIELKNISYKHKSNNNIIEVFSNLNMKFTCNQSIGLQGESGTGKTTFLNILAGLLTSYTGEILLDGKNIKSSMYEWRKNISYISQDIFLLRGSLRDNLLINLEGSNNLSDDYLINILEEVELGSFLQNINYNLDYLLDLEGSMISGGQKQRIAIARALVSNPKILILDEATNGLDTYVEKKIYELVINKLKNITKIIVSHNLSNLEKCQKLYKIENKKIIILK